MVETVSLVLVSLSILLIGIFVFWSLRLQISVGRGERTRLKRRDLDPKRKTFSYAVLAYFAFVIYLSVAGFLSLEGTNLPLNGASNEVVLLMGGVGFIGIGFVQTFMNPLKKLPQ